MEIKNCAKETVLPTMAQEIVRLKVPAVKIDYTTIKIKNQCLLINKREENKKIISLP